MANSAFNELRETENLDTLIPFKKICLDTRFEIHPVRGNMVYTELFRLDNAYARDKSK